MGKFLDVIKDKVDAKTVVGVASGLVAVVGMVLTKKSDDIAKHEAAEEAAKIVMEKLSSKES